jgi:putative ABC transport system permease protein
MIWLRLAVQSALARKGALFIMILSTVISVAILLGVLKIRDDAKTSFSNAISGVDLVLGSKGSPAELILYSVFHLGKPTNTIPASLEKEITAISQVDWIVPIQLGDSYRNYPVVGTSTAFFERVRAQGRPLVIQTGSALTDPTSFDVVLGSRVAKSLGLTLSNQIAIAHGSGSGPKKDHSDSPFKVVGILAATGTPIDQALYISTQAFDALHDIKDGGQLQFAKLDPNSRANAFFIGLKSRASIFSVRRQIDDLKNANLMAVMPGVALDDLWSTMEVAENALILIAYGVLLTTILGITATLLIALDNRRRELAILRAIGAKPPQILFFILAEAFLVCIIGILAGWGLLQALIAMYADQLRTEWGVVSSIGLPNAADLTSLLIVLCTVILFATIPAVKAYKMALNDGLNPPSP